MKIITVNLPTQISLNISHEQFIQLAEVNREIRLERTAKGELILNPPTGSETGKHNLSIAAQLWLWNQRTGLGVAFDSSTGFHLPNGANRSPDAAWVAQEKWDSLTSQEKEGFAPISPDFVIELRSKSDSLKPLQDKMREYLENQTLLGWLIDCKNQRVEIYRQGQEVEVLDKPQQLLGEGVLPGFVLDLMEVWQ